MNGRLLRLVVFECCYRLKKKSYYCSVLQGTFGIQITANQSLHSSMQNIYVIEGNLISTSIFIFLVSVRVALHDSQYKITPQFLLYLRRAFLLLSLYNQTPFKTAFF